MIVKNEEEFLPRCLRSAQGVVDQIVIVDTGSTDRTVEIARSFGAEVYQHPWKNDFSEARNVSLEHATGDWIIYLDADEEIAQEDIEKIKPLLASTDGEGFYMVETNFLGDLAGYDAVSHPTLRIFRNRKEYRFHGALHEQISDKIRGACPLSPLRLNHYGYMNKPLLDKNKLTRNREILLKEVKANPNNSFVHFNLGTEYTRTREFDKALQHYQKAFQNLSSLELHFASYLVRNIVMTLNELKRYQDALKVLEDAIIAYPNYTDLFYLRGLVYLNMKRYTDAISSFRECLQMGESHQGFVTQVGTGSFLAYYGMGGAYEQIGDLPHAVDAYARSLRHNKRAFAPALNALGNLLLSRQDPQEVKFYLEKQLDTGMAENLLALSAIFAQHRRYEIALAYVEQAEKLEGESSGRLLYARGEYLMNLKKYADADRSLAAVPEHNSFYPVATLSRGLSQLLRDDFSSAESIFGKVAEDESYKVAAETYRLFSQTIRGAAPQELTFTDAGEKRWFVQIALGLLSRLLELQEFEKFEHALPVLNLAGPSPLEISHAVGTIYYQLGFYDSAAEELMKAVDAGSRETAVYTMLADICMRREMAEEAAAFLYRSVELGDRRLTTFSGMASALCHLQKFDEASMALCEGLKEYPTSEVLRETLRSVELMAKTAHMSHAQPGR
ncbi:MAG: glycosyltransferase [Syntrophothermus sp.]